MSLQYLYKLLLIYADHRIHITQKHKRILSLMYVQADNFTLSTAEDFGWALPKRIWPLYSYYFVITELKSVS